MINHEDIFYARKLKELRVKNNYVQKMMADLLYCSQQEYSKLETGNKHFTKEIIKRICTVFKIKPEEFEVRTTNTAVQNNEMDVELNTVLQLKLVNAFDEKPQLNNIVQLFKTKYMLEGQLQLLDQLLAEKKKQPR